MNFKRKPFLPIDLLRGHWIVYISSFIHLVKWLSRIDFLPLLSLPRGYFDCSSHCLSRWIHVDSQVIVSLKKNTSRVLIEFIRTAEINESAEMHPSDYWLWGLGIV